MSNVTWRNLPTKKFPDQYPSPTAVFVDKFQGRPTAPLSTDGTALEDVFADAVWRIDAIEHQRSGAPEKIIRNVGSAGDTLDVMSGFTFARDSGDPRFLDWNGVNYVYMPGASFNRLAVSDAACLDITGDIDLRMYLAMDDWTPSGTQCLISKSQTTGNQRSYRWAVNTNGTMFITWSADGTNELSATSTASIPFSDGNPGWVRVILDVNNGASGNDVKFYTSEDGVTWTQLGNTVTQAGTTAIYAGAAILEIGALANSSIIAGKIFRVQVFNGIDGTKVFDLDTSKITTGQDSYIEPVVFDGVVGARLTGSGLSLPGTDGNAAIALDSPALDITGDLDIRIKVALDDWTPSVNNSLIGKFKAASLGRSYFLRVNTAGNLVFFYSTTGDNELSATSTVITGITDGATKWVRVTLDVNNGSGSNEVNFFLSDDGVSWTQLGTTITQSGTITIYNSTSALSIGAGTQNPGNTPWQPMSGTVYRAQILNGIDGTVAFDANFETAPEYATQITETSVNTALVSVLSTKYCSIGRNTTGRKSVAVTAPVWLFGVDDILTTRSALGQNQFSLGSNTTDLAAGDTITIMLAVRQWATPVANGRYICKGSFFGGKGWTIIYVSGVGFATSINANTNLLANIGTAPDTATGKLQVIFLTLSPRRAVGVVNGLTAAYSRAFADATIPNPIILGRDNSSTASQEFELHSAAVFRRELTATEMANIRAYYVAKYP